MMRMSNCHGRNSCYRFIRQYVTPHKITNWLQHFRALKYILLLFCSINGRLAARERQCPALTLKMDTINRLFHPMPNLFRKVVSVFKPNEYIVECRERQAATRRMECCMMWMAGCHRQNSRLSKFSVESHHFVFTDWSHFFLHGRIFFHIFCTIVGRRAAGERRGRHIELLLPSLGLTRSNSKPIRQEGTEPN